MAFVGFGVISVHEVTLVAGEVAGVCSACNAGKKSACETSL